MTDEAKQRRLAMIEKLKKSRFSAFKDDEPEEGLTEQGIEDYVLPVKNIVQKGIKEGGKAVIMSAVKEKVKVKPPKDVGTTITYDKPFGGKPTVKYDKPLAGAEDKSMPEWLKKLIDEE